MEFLTILIVLGLVQLWGSGGPLQRDDWFHAWINKIAGFFGPGKSRLLTIVAIPVVFTLFLQALFDARLFGLLSLILFIAVLLFCLGRGDFNDAIKRYLEAWQRGDFESAYDKAGSIGDFRQNDAIDDRQSLHAQVRVAMLYDGYQRWFAVVFWFFLLGPCGALGYRLSYLCARDEQLDDIDRQLAMRFIHYLDWIPARLLALSFSLTGNFVKGFNECGKQLMDNMPIPELLDCCAVAAINTDFTDTSTDSVDTLTPADESGFVQKARVQLLALQSLLSRSVICWLIILALLTLAVA